ncbi:DUF6308 family protein [Micromonospora sp. CA-244673]|uniref:DUF6308 family protein n=1 Tax=Micromonospora sp. CA-244673 TaxID=3239958 RepID=UPI003D8D6C12
MTAVVPPISVAGRVIRDPLATFVGYCQNHGGTLQRYDGLAGSSPSLTPQLIKATRWPWMNSRISRKQEEHLLRHSDSAPWQDVPVDARLHDADPLEPDGGYARMLRLYEHFFQERPTGLGHAKVSKCLYLMRPALFVILDSKLLKLYRTSAVEAADELRSTGYPHAPKRRAFWAAYRDDVLRASDALAALRAAARQHPNPVVVAAADRLTDVRIIDILAWSHVGR